MLRITTKDILVDSSQRNGTLITLIHADEQLASDPAQDAFVPSVLGMADLVLSIQGLGSGFSKDVHGQVKVLRKDVIFSALGIRLIS